MSAYSKEFVAASAIPLLLSILAKGESYGYEIIRQIKQHSGGKLEWSEGMLYPVLNKLEQKGIVAAVWRKEEQGRERKYYQLTQDGHALLDKERQNWDLITNILQQIWTPKTSLT
jgi:PadR family transcriptional regulator PadR